MAMEGAPSGEAIGWWVAGVVGSELCFTGGDESFEILGFSTFEDFVEGEVKDVIARFKLAVAMEAATELAHDAADTTEDAGAFEAEVLAVTNERACFIDQEFFEER